MMNAQSYDGVECNPYEVNICNICGGNYDDGNVCPHHVGERYNYEQCTTSGYRECNICGGNYDDAGDCPHHIGESYGGEVCSPYDMNLCNICGGNYDDAGDCPHHVGDEYGGIVCEPYSATMCNICDADYHGSCPHIDGAFYDEAYCEPFEGVACNICGRNYNDSTSCPHHVGVNYGGIVCSPYTITFCNLCGNDYNDGSVCPHHVGDAYGGTECNPNVIRICSMCGNNYDDGNACPHLIGEIYGGLTCEPHVVLVCNICGNDYNNPDACPHKVGELEEYGKFSSAIDSTQADQGRLDNIEQSKELYGSMGWMEYLIEYKTLHYVHTAAERLANAATIVGYNNAKKGLLHYLRNSGTPLKVDFAAMNTEYPLAIKYKNEQLNEALEAAEAFGKVTKILNIKEYSNDALEPWDTKCDWHYFVHSYCSSIEMNIVEVGDVYSAVINYKLNDFYDWKDNVEHIEDIPVVVLKQLHIAGMAREYEVYGNVEIPISWVKGDRIQ